MEAQGSHLPPKLSFPQVSRVPAALFPLLLLDSGISTPELGLWNGVALCSAPLLTHPWVGSCWPGVELSPLSALPPAPLFFPCPLTCPVSPSGSHCPPEVSAGSVLGA